MKTCLFFIAVSLFLPVFGGVTKQISKEEYVETWKKTAVQHMVDFKVPASITLAQGIIESGSGNSILVTKGNNHFGIKCSDWTGEKMYMDDDSKNECFRVYADGSESFLDHSKFLANKPRYSKLFELDGKDYAGWAKGLRAAGYATNPKYPEMLIETIEKLKLYELDGLNGAVTQKSPELLVNKEEIQLTQHTVLVHENQVKFVKAKKGDTFYKISKEFNLGLWQLYKYNDFEARKDVLMEGDIVYIQPKRHRSRNKSKAYKLQREMSLRQISQEEAIKLSVLMRENDALSGDEKMVKGQVIKMK